MPVDREALKAHVREAFAGDEALIAEVEQKLMANEERANNFLGLGLRNKDYTQKNQALAEERRRIEDEKRIVEQQAEMYRQQFEAAEAAKQQVLKDLAAHRETEAAAHARLKHIKQVYQLSDEDIPNTWDLRETVRTGVPTDSSRDLDERFSAFGEKLEKRLVEYIQKSISPELGGYVKLYGIFNDVGREHEALTGKPLSSKEHDELVAEAQRRNQAGRTTSYQTMWEEKFNVPQLRQERHDKELEKKLRDKWDAEDKARRSEEALSGVRPMPGEQQQMRTSNVLQHKFNIHQEAPTQATDVRQSSSAAERQMHGGADRATRRWLDRRAQGIPMGGPDERKPGGRAA